MFFKAIVMVLCALLFNVTPVICQANHHNATASDTVTSPGNSKSPVNEVQQPDDEFNLFLLLFALAGISFMAGFIFLGIASFILLILLIGLLVTTGIISTSIIIGWANKSYSVGLKYFLIITGSVSGLVFGALTFGLFCLFFKISVSKSAVILTGSITGLLGGLFLGIIIFKAVLLISNKVKRKWIAT